MTEKCAEENWEADQRPGEEAWDGDKETRTWGEESHRPGRRTQDNLKGKSELTLAVAKASNCTFCSLRIYWLVLSRFTVKGTWIPGVMFIGCVCYRRSLVIIESVSCRLAFHCWFPQFLPILCWMRIGQVQWASRHGLGSKETIHKLKLCTCLLDLLDP